MTKSDLEKELQKYKELDKRIAEMFRYLYPFYDIRDAESYFDSLEQQEKQKQIKNETGVKIGDEVFIHGYVDEIRKDTIIIRNEGGYFGTVESEIIYKYTKGDTNEDKKE